MSPSLEQDTSESFQRQPFASFAILDFETSNFPAYNFNKVGLTELSIYGVAISEFKSDEMQKEVLSPPPKLPRVLHKLTLMINPMMAIHPEATNVTGLDNHMLEAESKFDKNAAETLLGFLRHLQQPICLVAHNGYSFDFPILKYVMKRAGQTLPDNLYALDSLRAFHDIDELRQTKKSIEQCTTTVQEEEIIVLNDESETESKVEEKFDARALNETTPKRRIVKADITTLKRKQAFSTENGGSPISAETRRRLDFGEASPKCSINKARIESRRKWYPPKGKYKLGSIFLRTFLRDPKQAHYAEADVISLTQLMLHYGLDFVDYAEAHAVQFDKIPQLGEPGFI